MESREVSRPSQSLMTSIYGPEGQMDLTIGGTQRLMMINQYTKFYQNRRRSCAFLIDSMPPIWNIAYTSTTQNGIVKIRINLPTLCHQNYCRVTSKRIEDIIMIYVNNPGNQHRCHISHFHPNRPYDILTSIIDI